MRQWISKSIVLSLSAATLLSACASRQAMPLNPANGALMAQSNGAIQSQTFGDTPYQRIQEPDEGLTVRMVRSLYKGNFADDVDNGQDDENVPMPRGGLVYESLSRLSLFRKGFYLLSDKVIKKEFNKPGVSDAVPAITQPEVQSLLRILQPGDIVLCGNNDSFVHALLYLGNDQIIHALAQLTPSGDFMGVIKETLSGYTQRVSRDKFVVLRKPGLSQAGLQKMSNYAHSTLGTSYDSLFLLDTKERLYCTEMVFQALQAMGGEAPRVFPHRAKYGWDLFTVEDLMDSPDLETVWEYNYKRPQAGRLHQY